MRCVLPGRHVRRPSSRLEAPVRGLCRLPERPSSDQVLPRERGLGCSLPRHRCAGHHSARHCDHRARPLEVAVTRRARGLHADLVKRPQEHEAVTTEFLEDKKHTISSRHPRVSQAALPAFSRDLRPYMAMPHAAGRMCYSYMLSTSLPRLLPHECSDWASSLCRWRASALPVPARSR